MSRIGIIVSYIFFVLLCILLTNEARAAAPRVALVIDDLWQQEEAGEWQKDSFSSMVAVNRFLQKSGQKIQLVDLTAKSGSNSDDAAAILLARKNKVDLVVLGSTRSSLAGGKAAKTINPWMMTYDDAVSGTEKYTFSVNVQWQLIDPYSNAVVDVVSGFFLPPFGGDLSGHNITAGRERAREHLLGTLSADLFEKTISWWKNSGVQSRQRQTSSATRHQPVAAGATVKVAAGSAGQKNEPEDSRRGLAVVNTGNALNRTIDQHTAPLVEGAKPALWGLAIGVSSYADKKMNLQYADRDAESLAQFFNSGHTDIFSEVHFKTLLNKDVTRSAIIDSVSQHLGQAAMNDIVIIFLAGHGIKHRQSGSYYFVPYDANSQNILSRGLRMSDFEESVRILKQNVDRVVVVMDTCHAGAMEIGARGVEGGEDLTEALKNSNGLFILAASKAGESSQEASRYSLGGDSGHGAFTYSLLNALSGKANYDQNSFVSIHEIFQYVARQVPRLTGGSQHPYFRAEGTDLPLVEITTREQ